MPELPEVEVVKKSLEKTIYDLTIKNIEIRNKFLRYKIDEKLMKKMIKSKVLSITRRSKYIFINLNNHFTIMFHLGMTGKIIIVGANQNKFKTSFYYKLIDNKPIHDHLIFKFNKDISLIYNDVRKFGFVKIFKTDKLYLSSHLQKLGPEPLSKKFDFNYFKDYTKKKKIFLKDLLMNQKRMWPIGHSRDQNLLYETFLDNCVAQYKQYLKDPSVYAKKSYGPSGGGQSNSASVRQCSGRTLKGARCRRRTTSSSGRCFQH